MSATGYSIAVLKLDGNGSDQFLKQFNSLQATETTAHSITVIPGTGSSTTVLGSDILITAITRTGLALDGVTAAGFSCPTADVCGLSWSRLDASGAFVYSRIYGAAAVGFGVTQPSGQLSAVDTPRNRAYVYGQVGSTTGATALDLGFGLGTKTIPSAVNGLNWLIVSIALDTGIPVWCMCYSRCRLTLLHQTVHVR